MRNPRTVMADSGVRGGADTGGTFTDLVHKYPRYKQEIRAAELAGQTTRLGYVVT